MRIPFVFIPLCLAAAAQDPARSKPDPKHVDAAIQKGVDYLKSKVSDLKPFSFGPSSQRNDELILWTLIHARVSENDSDFQKLLKIILETDLERTYAVSLQAMILEELDRVRYQGRIRQCAQFLVDNQARNGQWSYGEPSKFVKDVATDDVGKDVPTESTGNSARPASSGKREKPKVARRVAVKKMREGPERGDNSNSQYAALGLRACHDAGIILPKEVVAQAVRSWRESQRKSRGLSYDGRGWSYSNPEGYDKDAYGSMTAGGLGSIAIYDYIQGVPWKRDRDLLDGAEWITRHFTVMGNAGAPEPDPGLGATNRWMYYYLYALERAGALIGTERFGAHEWYAEGANVLLKAQAQDGSWTATKAGTPIWDTCFAILFLRRATRPLEDVATVDPKKR